MPEFHLNAGAVDLVPLSEPHIRPILDLMNKEGWYYYDQNELTRYLRLKQDCFVMIKQDRVIGSLFTTNYGNQAWIGNIVVAAQERRRGLATEALKTVIGYLRGSKSVKEFRLGAVPLAIGLYRNIGFSPESFTSAQEALLPIPLAADRAGLDGSAQIHRIEPGDLPEIATVDARYLKSDRLFLLRELYRDSNKQACLCLKEAGRVGGFIMIRRRRDSKTEAGLAEGPDHAYRIGPACVLPEYGTQGFSALLKKALRAINDEVAQHEGSAKITILFPINANASDATTVTPEQPQGRIFESRLTAPVGTGSAKNEAQRRLMAELGFHQEYFEQVMAYSPLASSRHGAGPSRADASRPDPAGIFAAATPGDKA